MTVTIDVDNLPTTQYLILEVLAARRRCGEPHWTFPRRLRPNVNVLAAHGLVDMVGSTQDGIRVKLTQAGMDACLLPTYNVPVPTLAQALDTLPSTDDEYLAWMRKHQLGHGAGVGTVISCVRHDLRKLLDGGKP